METEKKNRRWLVLVFGPLLLALLGGGYITFTTGRASFLPGTQWISDQGSMIEVYILSPMTAENFAVGQLIQIHAEVWDLAPIDNARLLVDDQIVAELTDDAIAQPLQMSFAWSGDIPGAHTLSVQVNDLQGNSQKSQTVIVNLFSVPFNEVNVKDGQTLEEISLANGSSPEAVSALNSGIAQNAQLSSGQQLIIPASNAGIASSDPIDKEAEGDLQVQAGVNNLIQWSLNYTQPVDQSYCYQSADAVNWKRVPAQNFTFNPGQQWQQPVLLNAQQTSTILILDCWGWQGGVLKYLGQGQTIVSVNDIPKEITMRAGGFEAVGVPLIDIDPIAFAIRQEKKEVPAPYNLRVTYSISECEKYHGNHAAKLNCEKFLSTNQHVRDVLVWDWKKGLCAFGEYCKWVNDIRGFQIYQVDKKGKPIRLLQTLQDGRQNAAIPLSFGAKCYGVQAFSGSPLGPNATPIRFSSMDVFCLPDSPNLQTVTLEMDDWISGSGATWTSFKDGSIWDYFSSSGVCIIYGGSAPGYMLPKGNQIVVGTEWIWNRDNCYSRHNNGKAAIHFPISDIPAYAKIKRAALKFDPVKSAVYKGPEYPTFSSKPVCATRLYTNQLSWNQAPVSKTHVNYDDVSPQGGNRYWMNFFTNLISGAPYQSINTTTTELDVTGDVLQWQQTPERNYGFSFQSWTVDLEFNKVLNHTVDLMCWTTLGNIQLEVEFYAP